MGLFSRSKAKPTNASTKRVAVIDLKGVIAAEASGRQGYLNVDGLQKYIDRAFETPGVAAVALDINCPGGSPTQSELIGNYIRKKATETGLPVYAFAQDVAASGGYWLACAADKIYAARTSMVGSIGVISAHMAFNKVMDKYGVEYRVYTAGTSKSKLSPYQAEKPEDVAWLKSVLEETHTMFKDWVKLRRGDRLSTTVDLDKDVFNGNVWHAQRATDLGLIDGVGDIHSTLPALLQCKDVDLVRVQPRRGGLLSSLFNTAASVQQKPATPEAIAAAIADAGMEAIKREAVWSPYRMQ